jgi:TPP-dependent pyruvate/acetoin dehydrogenase alpha subunit
VCENNGLAVTTPIKDRQQHSTPSGIARAHGLYSQFCSTSDVDYIASISLGAIENARKGKPQFIEIMVERERTHVGVDHEYVLTNDPLEGYTCDESEIQREIEDAFRFAEESPAPTNPERGVYA